MMYKDAFPFKLWERRKSLVPMTYAQPESTSAFRCDWPALPRLFRLQRSNLNVPPRDSRNPISANGYGFYPSHY
jgi:hypothetical protein